MSRTQQRALALVIFLAAALMIGLRLFALDSDPYPRLSWSSGLLTDEGFYIHNARNVILFGTARTDQFNNMLIMPTLHFVQVAVFRAWGVGSVQARMISVVCSLLIILVFYGASLRAFGLPIACFAALFLGLDHITLLYNRMALMDTPGALLLVCGFYCWSVGIENSALRSRCWLALCGIFLGLAFCTRGLAVVVLPVPFLCLFWRYRTVIGTELASDSIQQPSDAAGVKQARHDALRKEVQRGSWIAAGLGFVLAIYFAAWYLPHRVELAHVNSFYLWRQLVPHNFLQLIMNLLNGFFGDNRGMAPFLMRHSPAQVVLVIGWLLAFGGGIIRRNNVVLAQERLHGSGALYVILWLILSVLFLCVVSYSPSRYYLLFTPPLALVAAFGIANGLEIWRNLLSSRWALPFVGGYCAYHFALETFHHSNLTSILLVAAGAVIGALIMHVIRIHVTHRTVSWESWRLAFPAAALALWFSVNTYFLADWLRNMEYKQRDAGRWLAAHLPADTVLIGDVAPGLCMDNRFRVVNVIAGLCNDRGPIGMYAGQRRAVVILDGRLLERGWAKFYPDLIRPERRLKLFPHIGRFPVGVYLVDERDL